MRIHHITLKINKEVSLIGKLKVFILFLLALYSMQPYFFWDKSIIAAGLSALLVLLYIAQNSFTPSFIKEYIEKQCKKQIRLYVLYFVYAIIIFCYFANRNFNNILLPFLSTFIPVIIFILCTEEEKHYFQIITTNTMSIICGVSLFFFLLYLTGVFSLPSYKIYHPTNKFYYYFENYILFIIVRGKNTLNIIPRFQSIFTEPGHLGMMCALLLYGNKYNFRRKRIIILLFSLIFSLSLAAYVLFFAGLILYKFFISRKKLEFIFTASFISVGLILSGFLFYKMHPESVLSQRILSRLVIDNEKGIAGNNRNTKAFDKEFELFKKEGVNLLFGTCATGNTESSKFPKGGNSSYKTYIYDFGLLGLFILILFYLSFIYGANSKIMFGMFILFSLSFLQRPYATWLSQILIFASSCEHFRQLDFRLSDKILKLR